MSPVASPPYILDQRAVPHGARRVAVARTQKALRTILGRTNYERLMFRRRVGYFPNLNNPLTINEKISRMKLYSEMREAHIFADKVAVRDHVARVIGPQYLTEAFLVTDDPDAIDFGHLPTSYVMKVNHGSGMSIVVRDKSQADEDLFRRSLTSFLKTPYGELTNEWWYLQIPRKIIIEEFLKDGQHLLPNDYRFWVFHGETKLIQVTADRFRDWSTTFYDRSWKPQELQLVGYPTRPTTRPSRLDEMIQVAEVLGHDFDMVRIDLYCIDDHVYFSEITLSPGAGWRRYDSRRTDEFLGSFW